LALDIFVLFLVPLLGVVVCFRAGPEGPVVCFGFWGATTGMIYITLLARLAQIEKKLISEMKRKEQRKRVEIE